MTNIVYTPFKNVKGFTKQLDEAGRVLSIKYTHNNPKRQYTIKLNSDSMIPRDGLLMADFLQKHAKDKRILDLGTGSGVLAIHSATFGAKYVLGTDIDNKALEKAERNGKLNGLKNIEWKSSDLFSEIKNETFDIILSNPPQLPMKKGLVKDIGGFNGRQIVEKIIHKSPQYLSEGGILLLTLFDFLSIEKKYGNEETLKDLFNSKNFYFKVINKERRPIRNGGKTEKSINHILNVYPRYKFQHNDKSYTQEIYLVCGKLKK